MCKSATCWRWPEMEKLTVRPGGRRGRRSLRAGPGGMTLSAVTCVRNEEAQLADCLATLAFADEIVVVLDRSTDGSKAIAEKFGAKIVEGEFEREGDRRHAGIDAATGPWISRSTPTSGSRGIWRPKSY